MLSFKCLRPGCDFTIDDGEHVEDVLQKLQVHYRAQHPRVWLRTQYTCEEIERYNQSVEDFLYLQFGANWQANSIGMLARTVQTTILAPRNENYYGPELREEALNYVNDNAAAVQAEAPVGNGGAVDAVAPMRDWIPFPAPDRAGF